MNALLRVFQPQTPALRVQQVLRLLAGFQLLLMLSTLPLWLNDGRFPAVPLFSVPALPPRLLAMVSAAFAFGCLLLVLKSPAAAPDASARRFPLLPCWLLLFGILAGCCNQHCLQAWHVFFLWIVFSGLIRDPQRQLAALRHLPACVYVCSGLSRLSLEPEAGPTGMILGQLTAWLPASLQPAAATFRLLCHAAAWSEVAVGLLLLSRGRLGGWATAAAMLLHAALLLALGPFGLNHNPAVLLWNLCFLCLLPLLCGRPNRLSPPPRAWVCLLWGISLAGLVGITDNWPSWQLYSSRPENWQLWIDRQYTSRLPPKLARATSSTAVDGLVPVRLDLASLQQTGSPLYPEDRFQLALIEHTLAQLPEACRFRVRIDQPQVWCWWRRTVRQISDRRALQAEHNRFWLNSGERSTAAIH